MLRLNWKQVHDNLLKSDLKKHSNKRIIFYASIGGLALAISMSYSNRLETYLAAGGGFLLGLSAEKFASRQIRRIAIDLVRGEKENTPQ
jgi:hypothetical protein